MVVAFQWRVARRPNSYSASQLGGFMRDSVHDAEHGLSMPSRSVPKPECMYNNILVGCLFGFGVNI